VLLLAQVLVLVLVLVPVPVRVLVLGLGQVERQAEAAHDASRRDALHPLSMHLDAMLSTRCRTTDMRATVDEAHAKTRGSKLNARYRTVPGGLEYNAAHLSTKRCKRSRYEPCARSVSRIVAGFARADRGVRCAR
jgi:hypothetical protein